MEKMLPNKPEAERGVLGSILLNPSCFDEVMDILSPGDFCTHRYQLIYEAMRSLWARHALPDIITIPDELERLGHLEAVGGTMDCTSLLSDLFGEVTTSGGIAYYAEMVRKTSERRQLIAAAGMIAKLAYEGDDQARDKAEQMLLSIGSHQTQQAFTSMPTLMNTYMEELNYLHANRGKIVGVPTGYDALDGTLGGLQKSDLVLLAGRPSMGKTSFGLCIGYNAALQKKRVAVFSLEMGEKLLARRFMSMVSKVDMQRLRSGWINDEEWEDIMQAYGNLSALPVHINDTAGNPVSSMRRQLRRLVQEQGSVDLVIVDYLGLIGPDVENSKRDNLVQQISQISAGLKTLAREFDVPVLALCQLSRKVEERQVKRPQLSDLRDSGCLTGETLVYLPQEGVYKRLDSLIGRRDFDVLALNTHTWKLEPKKVTCAFATGKKPVYKMVTRKGTIIRATASHKFLAFHGWKRLDELVAKESIALPRTLPGPQSSTMTHEELALLGHFIGDGCTLPKHAIQYTTVDYDLAELVAQLASQVFGDRIAPRIKRDVPVGRGGGWYQVFFSPTFHLTHRVYNPVAQWLREMNAFGFRSYEKVIPEKVFTQSPEGIATFLKHLWSTDGHVGCDNHGKSWRVIPRIFYATSSECLAKDVQSLLLRVGINARVSCVPQGTKGRHQYHVIVSGKPDMDRFIADIGMVGERKQQMLEQVRAHLDGRVANPNRDLIPSAAWRQLVVPAMAVIGMTVRQMHIASHRAYCGTGLYKQGMSRERASQMATVVQSTQLALLSQSDVYWDEIVSIEPDGEEEVYDLTVEKHHNFVANNMIVHNSLEQDADVVMFIYREDYYKQDEQGYIPNNMADIIIAKHRNGPTGTVHLYFQREQTMFYNMEADR